MQISELFYSIQGEGKRAGHPSFFIRTNYCNLRCRFPDGNLCDTPYTSWNPEDKKNLGDIPVGHIISEYLKLNCKDIVITGGEPTMYPENLLELCRSLKKANENIFITLETNGTYSGEFKNYIDLFSISPKLSSSVPYGTPQEKMHQKNRLNFDVLREFQELKDKDKTDIQWKFVFTGDDDLNEIREIQKVIGFKDEDIYLMPEGITHEDLSRNRLKTVEACIRNNFKYTDRLHIMIWGSKRGV
jgi:7-carboxy-7-deazaguanine synthase